MELLEYDQNDGAAEIGMPVVQSAPSESDEIPEERRKLVSQILATIRADKKHHEAAFKRMRRDMFIAMHGYDEAEWDDRRYSTNICGRHVKQKTAQLYARNPKVVAKRRETLDFVTWDENPDSLNLAMMTLQMMQQQIASAPVETDPVTGEPIGPMLDPSMEQAFQQAQAVMEDFQQGMQRRQDIRKLGKTLEVLFAHNLREQLPLDFKRGMKHLVRRANTTGVGYLKVAFQREYGRRAVVSQQIVDLQTRLDHLQNLVGQIGDGDIGEQDAETEEVRASIAALEAEPDVIVSEGLVIDYPKSTKVVPDRLTTTLEGFVGARHLAVEYMYTKDEVREIFKVDLKNEYRGYGAEGEPEEDHGSLKFCNDEESGNRTKGKGLVCVWEYYDKPSGLVYYVADGHKDFLREPAAPDVFVDGFWPVFALTFNATESEKDVFPLSDVALLLHAQREYNRSRQGQREHRSAARPRWVTPSGAIEDVDLDKFKTMEPFDVIRLNVDPQTKVGELFQAMPVPGVDPNLYETNQFFLDTQLVVGSQASSFGGVAKATATEASIAANSMQSADGASVDDLDNFLSAVARVCGQVLLREMSEEKVREIVGPGAFWPHQSLEEIANEVYLEVQAGSTGKPNQAVEIDNWQKMLPFLVQMPNISPIWTARETIRRLDDNADLTEALVEGMPSLMAQNAIATASANATPPQQGKDGPQDNPDAQGARGAQNGPAPPPAEQAGSEPAFGSNQV